MEFKVQSLSRAPQVISILRICSGQALNLEH